MTADPHVTRMANSRRSAYHYQHSQTTKQRFCKRTRLLRWVWHPRHIPSTERIRVRWALQYGTSKMGRVQAAGESGHRMYAGRCCAPSRDADVTKQPAKRACWYTWITRGLVKEYGIPVSLPSLAWTSDRATGCDVSWAKGQ